MTNGVRPTGERLPDRESQDQEQGRDSLQDQDQEIQGSAAPARLHVARASMRLGDSPEPALMLARMIEMARTAGLDATMLGS